MMYCHATESIPGMPTSGGLQSIFLFRSDGSSESESMYTGFGLTKKKKNRTNKTNNNNNKKKNR